MYIASSDISLKAIDALRNSSVAESSITFTQYAPESTEFGEITQNKGHFAVQGHSRSPIFNLVPIESSYTCRLPISD